MTSPDRVRHACCQGFDCTGYGTRRGVVGGFFVVVIVVVVVVVVVVVDVAVAFKMHS